MICPKCQANMSSVAFRSVRAERCDGCGGLWFGTLEHEDVKKLKEAERALDTGSDEKGREMNQIRKIDCPVCRTEMISLHVPDQPHIVVEQCAACHGIFMDAGEFRDFSHRTPFDVLRDLFAVDEA